MDITDNALIYHCFLSTLKPGTKCFVGFCKVDCYSPKFSIEILQSQLNPSTFESIMEQIVNSLSFIHEGRRYRLPSQCKELIFIKNDENFEPITMQVRNPLIVIPAGQFDIPLTGEPIEWKYVMTDENLAKSDMYEIKRIFGNYQGKYDSFNRLYNVENIILENGLQIQKVNDIHLNIDRLTLDHKMDLGNFCQMHFELFNPLSNSFSNMVKCPSGHLVCPGCFLNFCCLNKNGLSCWKCKVQLELPAVKELTSEIKDLKNQNLYLTQINSNKHYKIENLETEVGNLNNQLEISKQETNEANGKIKQLESELFEVYRKKFKECSSSRDNEIANLHEEKEQMRIENEDLKNLVDALRNGLDYFKNECKFLEKENARLIDDPEFLKKKRNREDL